MSRLDFRGWVSRQDDLHEVWGRTHLAALTAALAMALTGCGGKPKDQAEKERVVRLAKDTAKIGPNGYMAAKELLEKHGIDAKSVIGDPPRPQVSEERPTKRIGDQGDPAQVLAPPGVTLERPPGDRPPPTAGPKLDRPPPKKPNAKEGPDLSRVPSDKMNLGPVLQTKVSLPGRAYRHEYVLLVAEPRLSNTIEDAAEAYRHELREQYLERDIGDAFGLGKSPEEAAAKALERAQVQEENKVETWQTVSVQRILGGKFVAVIVYGRSK